MLRDYFVHGESDGQMLLHHPDWQAESHAMSAVPFCQDGGLQIFKLSAMVFVCLVGF